MRTSHTSSIEDTQIIQREQETGARKPPLWETIALFAHSNGEAFGIPRLRTRCHSASSAIARCLYPTSRCTVLRGFRKCTTRRHTRSAQCALQVVACEACKNQTLLALAGGMDRGVDVNHIFQSLGVLIVLLWIYVECCGIFTLSLSCRFRRLRLDCD